MVCYAHIGSLVTDSNLDIPENENVSAEVASDSLFKAGYTEYFAGWEGLPLASRKRDLGGRLKLIRYAC